MNPELSAQVYYMTVIFAVVLALLCARAAFPGDCDNVLQLCDASNARCQELVQSQRDLITAQDNLIIKVTKQRNEALDMVKPAAGIPWYVTIVVGIAGGVILTRGLR